MVVGCSIQSTLEELEYEQVELVLAQWPGELPNLLYWRVQMYAPNEGIFYNTELPPQSTGEKLRVKKNSPFYVCAFPVTGDSQKPQQFFKCAGAVYPWECSGVDGQIQLSWTSGYVAYLMRSLIKAAEASGYRGPYVSQYIGSFNWLKLIQVLEQKQQEALEAEDFYNPWHLDTQQVLEAIAYENFTAVKLKMSGVFSMELEFPVYSSYVPENEFCGPAGFFEKGVVTVPKNRISLFALSQNMALMIYGDCEKKVSLEFISMPIYIEGI